MTVDERVRRVRESVRGRARPASTLLLAAAGATAATVVLAPRFSLAPFLVPGAGLLVAGFVQWRRGNEGRSARARLLLGSGVGLAVLPLVPLGVLPFLFLSAIGVLGLTVGALGIHLRNGLVGITGAILVIFSGYSSVTFGRDFLTRPASPGQVALTAAAVLACAASGGVARRRETAAAEPDRLSPPDLELTADLRPEILAVLAETRTADVAFVATTLSVDVTDLDDDLERLLRAGLVSVRREAAPEGTRTVAAITRQGRHTVGSDMEMRRAVLA